LYTERGLILNTWNVLLFVNEVITLCVEGGTQGLQDDGGAFQGHLQERALLSPRRHREKVGAINILTECLKCRPTFQQMQKSMLHQIVHVRFASETQKIQAFDWLS